MMGSPAMLILKRIIRRPSGQIFSLRRLRPRCRIEEPDATNGRHGYRILSPEGRQADETFDLSGAKVRSRFKRNIFHPSLPDAAWNAFRVGDYDTAVFEAFKAIESAVRKKGGFTDADFGVPLMEKAFDPDAGPLCDKAAKRGRRERRCELFKGSLGEIRNPKGHGDPTITDPLMAVEEMMTAGVLQRIVEKC
jgi:uncharacterized protein (TIGR02391 family)